MSDDSAETIADTKNLQNGSRGNCYTSGKTKHSRHRPSEQKKVGLLKSSKVQCNSVQSLDRFDRRGNVRDDSAETIADTKKSSERITVGLLHGR